MLQCTSHKLASLSRQCGHHPAQTDCTETCIAGLCQDNSEWSTALSKAWVVAYDRILASEDAQQRCVAFDIMYNLTSQSDLLLKPQTTLGGASIETVRTPSSVATCSACRHNANRLVFLKGEENIMH